MARNIFLTVATAIALLSGEAMAAAGTFLLSSGDVQVRDTAGTLRGAKTGMEINSGETILTRSGRAQVRFTDSGQISLQPGTEFTIVDYRFRESGKPDESAVFNLIKGGVRALTGLVGRRVKTDYVMNTVVATIGIRGTEFQATLCASSCKEPDGLYVHTGEGIVFVKNALGEIEVGRGQTAFVASPDSAPQRTSAGPSMTTAPQITQPPVILGVTEPGFQPGTIISSNPLGPLTVISGGGIAGAASGSITVDGTAYSGVSGAGSGSAKNDSTAIVGAYINGNNVNGWMASADGAFASVVTDSVLNGATNGDLYWGRWSGGNVTLFAGLNGMNATATVAIPTSVSLHYILGTSVPTVPLSGSNATFSFVGGTSSTDASGGLGSGITGGTVTVNFASSYVGANMNIMHGSTTSNVNAMMPMGSNRRSEFSSENGGFVSGANVASGTVSGFLVGTTSPTGAGLSYSINNGVVSIVGVGAFR